MKVSDLVEQLTYNYRDDMSAELFVAYWDKEGISTYFDKPGAVTDEVWKGVVDEADDGEYVWQSEATDTLVEILREHAEEAGIDINGEEE